MKRPLSTCRGVNWVLVAAVAACAGKALAQSTALNPAQLGTFCPPGSELVDATRTSLVSAKEQVQIRKKVQGFMALDATARRSHGHPAGPQPYWEKGYTAMFDTGKDVPHDGVRYIAYWHANTCAGKDGAFAVILLDVADLAGKKIEKIFDNGKAFLSPQYYWDAFSKTAIALPDDWSSPKQPIVFTALPLYRSGFGDWFIQQGKTPKLLKYDVAKEQAEITEMNRSAGCDAPTPRDASSCKINERYRQEFMKYSRPAWSIYPKDVKPGSTSPQSGKH